MRRMDDIVERSDEDATFVSPRVPVVITGGAQRWHVEVPGIPTCDGAGSTREEALSKAEAALSAHFAALYERALLSELADWQDAGV
jgi:predicted RNase H-like HicB family nuclease